MKNNKPFFEKKKILLLVFIWICWFFPYIPYEIESYPIDKFIQGLLLIVVMTVSTICYYLINNNIFKISVFLISLAGVTFVSGINVALSVFPVSILIFLYKISGTENKKVFPEKIINVLLCIAPVSSIACVILNLESLIEKLSFSHKSVVIGAIFIIAFAIMLSCPYVKGLKKNQKISYKLGFLAETIGIVGSISTLDYVLDRGIMFFPWVLFVTLLIFEEDKVLYSSAGMLTEKVKVFLGINSKKTAK